MKHSVVPNFKIEIRSGRLSVSFKLVLSGISEYKVRIIHASRNCYLERYRFVTHIYRTADKRTDISGIYSVFKRCGIGRNRHRIHYYGETLHLSLRCPDIICFSVVKRLTDVERNSAGGFHILFADFNFNNFACGSVKSGNVVSSGITARTENHFLNNTRFAVRNVAEIQSFRSRMPIQLSMLAFGINGRYRL